MTKADDEFGKRVLTPLQPAPPLHPQIAAGEKARFLLEAEKLCQGFAPGTGSMDKQADHGLAMAFLRKRPMFLLKGLAAALLALIILVGSSLTVSAAQDSFPGDTLYPLKEISEDIRLSLTRSPQARLDVTLDYTNRRVDEITHVLATGKPLTAQASDRFQVELESALQLAAQMEDTQMQNALGKIKNHAENQAMTIEELISNLPEQAEPAIVHLQERLREQVKLSTDGKNDPQTFRLEIRERQNRPSGSHKPTATDNDTTSTPVRDSTAPLPTEAEKDHEDGVGQPTQVPDHGSPDPGQGNSSPGNGNHGPNPSHTPKP